MTRRRPRVRRYVSLMDRRLARRWHGVRVPPRLERALIFFVRLGDGWIWPLAALALALALPRERALYLIGQGLLAAALSLPSYWGLKALFRRARPGDLYSRIVPRVSPRDLYSFPSGHTMNNLAIGAALALHLPWLWPLTLSIPVAIGLLRVLLGVHFLSDVAAGTILGLATGIVAWLLWPVLLG